MTKAEIRRRADIMQFFHDQCERRPTKVSPVWMANHEKMFEDIGKRGHYLDILALRNPKGKFELGNTMWCLPRFAPGTLEFKAREREIARLEFLAKEKEKARNERRS